MLAGGDGPAVPRPERRRLFVRLCQVRGARTSESTHRPARLSRYWTSARRRWHRVREAAEQPPCVRIRYTVTTTVFEGACEEFTHTANYDPAAEAHKELELRHFERGSCTPNAWYDYYFNVTDHMRDIQDNLLFEVNTRRRHEDATRSQPAPLSPAPRLLSALIAVPNLSDGRPPPLSSTSDRSSTSAAPSTTTPSPCTCSLARSRATVTRSTWRECRTKGSTRSRSRRWT